MKQAVKCQAEDGREVDVQTNKLDKIGQNINADTEKKKAAYTIMQFMETPSTCRSSHQTVRAPGGVCALVTKICTRHGWRNSTHRYAEGQADCAVYLGRSSGLLAAEGQSTCLCGLYCI